ncbi:hypothetical protein SAMN05216588_12939 [Pseudomonas flavescens]|uniref:Uncharacterized protein n=1 Tax=Phytopseudomonas flavescens TaxID=29435 RepID=A0A1G8PKE4_9GAMM|nr:hypothetical protein [Pseudomonas flavescens]SDI92963.1 hypothetical protein SAMN05216588_12939 [Pseudomonas flavescens]
MLEDLHRSSFKCRRGFCLGIGVILLSKLARVVPALLLGKVVDGFYQSSDSGRVEAYQLGFMLVGLVNVVLMPIQG